MSNVRSQYFNANFYTVDSICKIDEIEIIVKDTR